MITPFSCYRQCTLTGCQQLSPFKCKQNVPLQGLPIPHSLFSIPYCPFPHPTYLCAMPVFTLRPFAELRPDELYEILQLRSEVFVVEQNCVYQDMDNKDLKAWHLMGREDGKLVVYTRLLAPGISYEQASIGRVVSSPSVRGRGLGRLLMEESIRQLYTLMGKQEIRIGAQLYLKDFYSSLGFIPDGDVYLEDGIEHITMYKP